MEIKPTFFSKPSGFQKWLKKNHGKANELWVGFYKKDSGKSSITWPESVDEALCYGWIDGIRKTIDEFSYTIRFTPRKKQSNWSTVNIKRVAELTKLGLMAPAGLKIFEERDQKKVQMYSFEQTTERKLPPPYQKKLKANKKAWAFFQAQAPYYQRTASWWVISAKQEETRLKRLGILIKNSEAGEKIPLLRRPDYKKKGSS